MRRYWRLFLRVIGFQAMSEMEFNLNFVANVLLHLTWLLIPVLFYQIIYLGTESISGWSYGETLLLIGTFQIFEGINQLTYFGGVFNFLSGAIRTGDLDFILIRPVNSQFLVSIKMPDIFGLTDLLFGVFLVLYACFQLHITLNLINLLLYGLFVTNAVLVGYSIFYLLSLSVFFVVKESSFLYVVDETIDEIITKPSGIFGRPLTFLLTFVIPLLCMTLLPVKALLQQATIAGLVWGLAVGAGLLWLSNWAWRSALKRYTSASS